MPGSAPVAPMPLAGASILHKGKIHAGAQEHILSGASLGSVVQLTALLIRLLWSQILDLGKKNECLSFWSVTAGLSLGNICSGESRAA